MNRVVKRYLVFLLITGMGGFGAIGCAVLEPKDPPALPALNSARMAIQDAKTSGAAERFPKDFKGLETRHLMARGAFYACQEDKALQMANDLVTDANELATRPLAVAPSVTPNQSPVARLSGPSEGYINMPVQFDATGSLDPDGDALSYIWNFGDGKTERSTSPSVTHTYGEVGNYTARVEVEDSRGASESASTLVQVRSRETVRSDVLFGFDQDRLKPTAESTLSGIVQKMRDNTSYHVELIGHTDAIGPETYNLELSKQRAEAVRDLLIEKGIAAERITTDWKGENAPVASNATADGRAENRRTDITLKLMP